MQRTRKRGSLILVSEQRNGWLEPHAGPRALRGLAASGEGAFPRFLGVSPFAYSTLFSASIMLIFRRLRLESSATITANSSVSAQAIR